MNTEKDPLGRLLRSAARAPRPEPAEAPFATEARCLAAWRSAEQADNSDYLVAWLRRAAICAGGVALACLALNYRALAGSHTGADELAVADATMRTGVEP
jgi:hypothetical protein